MLSLAFPWALGLLAATALVALFYFLRMRFRRQPVSSTFLWSKLVEPNEGGARLKWRSVALLVLQLAAVVAVVLAVAGLQFILSAPVKPGTLYVVDTSASMGVREPGQTGTRLDGARRALLADRETAGTSGPVAVYSGTRKVWESTDGSGLEGHLASLTVTDAEFAEGPASEVLGTWLQTNPGSWSGVLVSDGGLDQGGTRLSPLFAGRWRTLDFALEAPNLAITGLRVITKPQPQAEITVFNGFALAQSVTIALSPSDRRRGDPTERGLTDTVAPGTSVLLVPLDEESLLWSASLVDNADAWGNDDTFTTAVEPPRPARILHLGPADPFLRAAFPGAVFENRPAGPAGHGPEGAGPWDLVLAETTSDWQGNLVTWGPLPPDAPVFWGPPVTGNLSGPPSAHPLSRWVPWSDVAVTAGRGLVVNPGATVLAEAGGWPVAAAWEKNGTRFLALGFDTRRSNLGLTPVLPVLMRNLRQTLVPQEANPLASNLRVGKTTSRAGSEAWRVVSATAASGPSALEAVRRGSLWELTPREVGTYVWVDGSETGTLAVQYPVSESDTAPRKTPSGPQESAESGEPGTGSWSQAVSLVPWATLLVFSLLAAEWFLWNGRWSPRGNRALALLRLAAAAAVLLALVGLVMPWPTTARNLTLVFDTSASLGPELVEQQRQAAIKLVDKLAPADRVALVAFSSEARVLSGLQARDQARATLEAAPLSASLGPETNLQNALATGAQLLADEPGVSSQTLFSDGRANTGGDLEALSAQAKRFPISVVPLGRSLAGVAGQSLELPNAVRPGEQAAVKWRAWADEARTVVLGLAVDGAVVETRRQTLTPGENSAEFVVTAGKQGTRKVEVRVTTPLGLPLDSASASGLLTVEGRASVLVVQGPGTGPGLAQALTAQGLPVITRGPSGLPDSAAGYQSVSAVVLDNVAASALAEDQQRHLQNWVAGGGGLLVVGGDGSLGRGEYYTSALEALLPVQTDNRQRLQFTRSRILFVVDHSGSMSETVGATTKLEAALGGIAQTLDQLSLQDEVGLLEFDSEADWVIPFTPVAQKATILEGLNAFSQGGGTDLTKALDEVTLAFGHPGPVKRHVILMTDGQTGGEDQFFETFTETMKAAQVSMTVLGIGNEVNDALLRRLASGSDGVYYRAMGSDIPAILHQETVRVTRDLIQEGHFTPLVAGRDPVLDLGAAPLPVLGYLVTVPKALSRVRWEVQRPDGSRDPLYTDWRYGAGRVAVFASDSGRRWMTPWSGQPEYNRFWGQAVRSLETGSRDKALGLQVTVSASVARVVVEAVDARGGLRSGASLVAAHEGKTTPLVETAPGRYEAELPLEAGLQLVTVTDRTGPGRTWAWAWNPLGAELARGGADWAGLGRLASGTGGMLQPLTDPAPPPPSWAWAPVRLGDGLLALALTLFLIELAWRSLSLGQLKAARAQFVTWWRAQSRPWAKTFAPPPPRNEAEVERRTREAYKFLASRKRPGA